MARALTSASIRSGSSINHPESPAASTRASITLAMASRLERRQQLSVDVFESTIRHDDDEIAVAGLFRHGLDDVVHPRHEPCVLAGGLERVDQPLDRQSLILGQRRAENLGK